MSNAIKTNATLAALKEAAEELLCVEQGLQYRIAKGIGTAWDKERAEYIRDKTLPMLDDAIRFLTA
jgi:uncharacterized protein YbaR (Trm112 family)